MVRATPHVLIDAILRVHRHNGLLFAGHMAFTAMLSFFPFLIFLTALAGFVGEPATAAAFVERVFDLVPDQVDAALHPAVTEVLTQRRGGLLTLSLVGAVWVASSGVEALRHALNTAYGIAEIRPFWQRRLESLVVVVTGGFVTLVLSLSVILGPAIWSVLTAALDLPAQSQTAVGTARDVVAGIVLAVVLTLLHRLLPCRHQRVLDVLPGALLTAGAWIALATLFSLYLSSLAGFSVTYGSLGGIVLTLVYFHVSAVLFIFGAELNAAAMAWRRRQADDAAAAGRVSG